MSLSRTSCSIFWPLALAATAILSLSVPIYGHLEDNHHCHNETGSCSTIQSSNNTNNNEKYNIDYNLGQFIHLKEITPSTPSLLTLDQINSSSNSTELITDFLDYINQRLILYLENHKIILDVPGMLNATKYNEKTGERDNEVGRSGGFLAGFGLGFLAFGLKKLLLPVIIGAQIVKSVLIAMFLPSILGGLGKLVGKGVSTFASASGSSGGLSGGGGGGGLDDFEFKDPGYEGSQDSASNSEPAENKYSFAYPDIYGNGHQMIGTLPASALYSATASVNSLTNAAVAPSYQSYASSMSSSDSNAKVAYVNSDQSNQGSYYTRHRPQKTVAKQKEAFKVFHNIPQSSLLLTDYDPFYSPLLSRLDAVFKQLSYDSEDCRERLVCSMYRNPAQFAPYSNLVSAQLSRELNELKKPSTDNPEILRFFRYMRAAKDGQEGSDCFALHPKCPATPVSPSTSNSDDKSTISSSSSNPPPMLKTYQDINKLVQARELKTH